MNKLYRAVAISPDGHEQAALDFTYDTHTHESFSSHLPNDAVYLTVDAPGVAAFCWRFIERGYLEFVRPLGDDWPLFVADENSIAKGLAPNVLHPLTLAWAQATAQPLNGHVVAILEARQWEAAGFGPVLGQPSTTESP